MFLKNLTKGVLGQNEVASNTLPWATYWEVISELSPAVPSELVAAAYIMRGQEQPQVTDIKHLIYGGDRPYIESLQGDVLVDVYRTATGGDLGSEVAFDRSHAVTHGSSCIINPLPGCSTLYQVRAVGQEAVVACSMSGLRLVVDQAIVPYSRHGSPVDRLTSTILRARALALISDAIIPEYSAAPTGREVEVYATSTARQQDDPFYVPPRSRPVLRPTQGRLDWRDYGRDYGDTGPGLGWNATEG